jgi:branched-chain amino acid transport system ATP-binding protein
MVLTGVSLEIDKVEVIGIIGPNGAGKTCLLNCINGFYHLEKGRINFEGKNITHLPPHRIADLGIGRTFQGNEIYLHMTVIQNLLAGRHTKMKSSTLSSILYWPWEHLEEIEHRKQIEFIIDFLEMESIRNEVAGSLGFGLRKRVDLGRALALEPKILLLDEPMAGMNLEEKEDMARFIIDIKEAKKIPIIIVEHDMEVIMDIAQRVIVLDWGHKIAEGPPDVIKTDERVIQVYLGLDQ